MFHEITKRNLIYHVYAASRNDGWRQNVAELRKRLALFNGRRVVAVALGPAAHGLNVVQAEFGDDAAGIQWITVPNDTRLREVRTFRPLLDAVASTAPDEATWYGHTKANTTKDGMAGAWSWARAMYANLLDRWPDVSQALQQFAAVGTTQIAWTAYRRFPYPSGLQRGTWMFAGTFYWFRHDRIFGDPRWSDIPRDRYGAESWLAGFLDQSEVHSIYQPWPPHQWPNPYESKWYGGY